MNKQEAIAICESFATQHGLEFKQDGECGFGRKCVGFLNPAKNAWLDYNPFSESEDDYDNKYFFDELEPPEGVGAYHKHNCFAVLGHGEKSIKQLASWILNIQKKGKLSVVKYTKQYTDMTSFMTGNNDGYTVIVERYQHGKLFND